LPFFIIGARQCFVFLLKIIDFFPLTLSFFIPFFFFECKDNFRLVAFFPLIPPCFDLLFIKYIGDLSSLTKMGGHWKRGKRDADVKGRFLCFGRPLDFCYNGFLLPKEKEFTKGA